jgi:hypothetical protein
VPTPEELLARYDVQTPEALAHRLGYAVRREEDAPAVPGVRVASQFVPPDAIILYRRSLAAPEHELPRREQWHIAHELYHALWEAAGGSPWRISETEADRWADRLLALSTADSAE